MALCVHSKFQEVLLTSCPENLHVKILALMLFSKTVVGLQHNSERILLEILVYNEYTFGTLQKTNCLERFRTVTKIEKVWAAACTSWFFRYFMAAILNCYFNWQYSGLFSCYRGHLNSQLTVGRAHGSSHDAKLIGFIMRLKIQKNAWAEMFLIQEIWTTTQ